MAKGPITEPAPKVKGGSSPKEDAAQDLIDAVQAGDAKGAALSFATLYELCASAKAEDDEPEY
jgi:hypothetical protein